MRAKQFRTTSSGSDKNDDGCDDGGSTSVFIAVVVGEKVENVPRIRVKKLANSDVNILL